MVKISMYKKVFVNQCGYLPQMDKKVTFCSDNDVSFSVLKSDGTCVYNGKATERIENKAAKEINYIGDFSQITEPGKYYITAKNLGESDTFEISDTIYDDVFQKAMKFFYLQRCGQDISKDAAGEFAHCACHTGLATVYGTSIQKVVSGGWHDAGDYGRYVVPGAMSVAQLLLAYERNNKLDMKYTNKYGASDNPQMPDYLAEVKYELDWMLKMQNEDGMLYHKATCRNFCGFIMPDKEKEELVLSPVSTTATGDFAAVTAMAVRFYEKYDKSYAATLEAASRKAYKALKNMELPGGFKNPKDILTGEYDDECDEDERYWAAAELYKAFGDKEYKEDFERMAQQKIYHGYGWVNMGSYGNIAYLTTSYDTSDSIKDKIKKSMIELADTKLAIVSSDGYGIALSASEYTWGSNLDTANNGLHLYDAYKLTGNKEYLIAAQSQIHYLLGRNPMGLCYLTGCGTDSIKHPHHRPSGFLGKAMPGMLSGGPCDWLADAVTQQIFTKDTAPAKSLADMTGSYSTNEVTIYWNSAFVQLLAYVMA